MSAQDAVITFTENDNRVSPTKHTSRDLSLQSEPASNTQEQAEPLQCTLRQSPILKKRKVSNSHTNIL